MGQLRVTQHACGKIRQTGRKLQCRRCCLKRFGWKVEHAVGPAPIISPVAVMHLAGHDEVDFMTRGNHVLPLVAEGQRAMIDDAQGVTFMKMPGKMLLSVRSLEQFHSTQTGQTSQECGRIGSGGHFRLMPACWANGNLGAVRA